MQPRIPNDVRDYERAAREALDDPNLDQARRILDGDAEARRGTLDRLRQLGWHELSLETHDEALAAGFLCTATGWAGSTVGMAGLLTARAAGRAGSLQAIGDRGTVALVNHCDTPEDAAVIDISGNIREVVSVMQPAGSDSLAPYASVVQLDARRSASRPLYWCLHEMFEAFTSLGGMERAIALCRTHLHDRHQFGRPLRDFQVLQHRFTDMLSAQAGLRELALYTLWRLVTYPDDAMVDVLGLRTCHIESSRAVFRHAHQIHAAIGFCDEHPLSVLSRAARFSQYNPLTIDETLEAGWACLGRGWDAPFALR
jgi:3-oxo-4-pregnene-20-carboxyl-CoA dehydrogenase alpha subunit